MEKMKLAVVELGTGHVSMQIVNAGGVLGILMKRSDTAHAIGERGEDLRESQGNGVLIKVMNRDAAIVLATLAGTLAEMFPGGSETDTIPEPGIDEAQRAAEPIESEPSDTEG